MAATVGERIRERRQAKSWTLTKLASIAETSHGYLSDVENGKVSAPASIILAKVAKALDTSTDYLLGLSDNPTPPSPNHPLTPAEQLAAMGVDIQFARGGPIRQEDVEFFKRYLKTVQAEREAEEQKKK